jgi:hypothetical protein
MLTPVFCAKEKQSFDKLRTAETVRQTGKAADAAENWHATNTQK